LEFLDTAKIRKFARANYNTYGEFAAALGLTRSYVSMIMNGRHHGSIKIIARLCKLGMPIDDIFLPKWF